MQEHGGRHPLEPIVNEFQRDFGEVRIDLDHTPARAFVDAYLDTEPNRLDDPFREALTRQTDGNPLFTVEMVRVLWDRGELVQDEAGRWVVGENLDWRVLPARVEAVVAERVRHLSPPAYQILRLASVVGKTFTAEILARVKEIDTEGPLRDGELERAAGWARQIAGAAG